MSNEDIKDLLQMIMTCSKNLDAKLTLDSGCCKCLLEYIDGLKERIEYLERSNNRREETILDLRSDNVDLATKIDKAIRMLEINIEITKQQPSNNKLEDKFFINRCNNLIKILKGDVDE